MASKRSLRRRRKKPAAAAEVQAETSPSNVTDQSKEAAKVLKRQLLRDKRNAAIELRKEEEQRRKLARAERNRLYLEISGPMPEAPGFEAPGIAKVSIPARALRMADYSQVSLSNHESVSLLEYEVRSKIGIGEIEETDSLLYDINALTSVTGNGTGRRDASISARVTEQSPLEYNCGQTTEYENPASYQSLSWKLPFPSSWRLRKLRSTGYILII